MKAPIEDKNIAYTHMLPNSQIHFSIKPDMVFKDVILYSNVFVDIKSVFIEESGKLVINICGLPKLKNITYGQ